MEVVELLTSAGLYTLRLFQSKLAYNTVYTAHFVRSNFDFTKTSHMLGTLSEIALRRNEIK